MPALCRTQWRVRVVRSRRCYSRTRAAPSSRRRRCLECRLGVSPRWRSCSVRARTRRMRLMCRACCATSRVGDCTPIVPDGEWRLCRGLRPSRRSDSGSCSSSYVTLDARRRHSQRRHSGARPSTERTMTVVRVTQAISTAFYTMALFKYEVSGIHSELKNARISTCRTGTRRMRPRGPAARTRLLCGILTRQGRRETV